MERTLRQLHFCIQTLATIRACLTGMVRWHLMEMFTVPLGYPVTPLKEHPPRRVRDRLCEVSIFHHVARLQVFSNNCVDGLVMEEIVCCLCNEIQTLTGNDIVQNGQGFLCFMPPVTSVTLPRQVTLEFNQPAFCCSVKSGIRYRLPIRGGKKVLRAYVYTTSRFWHTRYRVWHINYDKNVPASSRLLQRDSFRVSGE